eukprot:5612668-Pyramimonas_sp.AAC.1
MAPVSHSGTCAQQATARRAFRAIYRTLARHATAHLSHPRLQTRHGTSVVEARHPAGSTEGEEEEGEAEDGQGANEEEGEELPRLHP